MMVLKGNVQKTRPFSKKGAEAPTSISPLQIAGGVARGADRLLTAILVIFLLGILFYAGLSLWDTWRIYDQAKVDESLLQYKPEVTEDDQSFAELQAINPDVRAWITIEDTHIDSPVVQGKDNVTYVNTDVYGEFSLSGSIFLDSRNAGDFSDPYSLLYGHHMDGEVMFGELAYFTQSSYFQAHQTGVLYVPNHTYEIEIFACLQTDAYDTQLFTPGKLTESEMKSLLERIQEISLQYREIGVTAKDKLLALSTCSDASTNARTIVIGRLVDFQ